MQATPIGPPSTPSGDARLVSSYFYWDTQVRFVDALAPGRISHERRVRADDLRAAAALKAARPESAKGRMLQRTASAAFRLDAAASSQFLLSYLAAADRKPTSAAEYKRKGKRLERLADRKFDAADNIGTLPY
jgi:hypothetical protein